MKGWPTKINRAGDRTQLIADGLASDYGSYIVVPKGISAYNLIQWSLCQIASRVTAGKIFLGALESFPMIDMVWL